MFVSIKDHFINKVSVCQITQSPVCADETWSYFGHQDEPAEEEQSSARHTDSIQTGPLHSGSFCLQPAVLLKAALK